MSSVYDIQYNTDMSSIQGISIPADALNETLQPQQATINNAHKLILMGIIRCYKLPQANMS